MIPKPQDLTLLKLRSHSAITSEDAHALGELPSQIEYKRAGEDIVRQGDRPNVAIVVLSGWVARYHSLANGRRQFLSFHCAGDMPDAQSLFLERMDHSVCAIDDAVIATVPHRRILDMFTQRPSLGLAIWRETLVDAAIFRQAITSLGSRDPRERLAHFFAEHFIRASTVGLTQNGVCPFPLTQQQIGDALGMAPVTMSRALRTLRKPVPSICGISNCRSATGKCLPQLANSTTTICICGCRRLLDDRVVRGAQGSIAIVRLARRNRRVIWRVSAVE